MEDGKLDPSDPTLSGRIDGLDVTFRLVTRDWGGHTASWTECEVATATDQLAIALRPQTRDEERWVQKGLARDVVVGDDEFDDKFIVEAAPADMAKRALDEDLRAALLAHHPLEVTSRAEGLLVEKRGWIEEREAIQVFAEMCAHLATSMETVLAEAREDGQRGAALAGYRGADPKAQRESELEVREQTEELKALRRRRERVETLRYGILFAILLAGLVAALTWQRCI